MAGKDKVERGIRIMVDDSGGTARDISSSVVPGSLSGPGLNYESAELTGVSQTVRNFLSDKATAQLSFQCYMDDTATTGSFTVITGNQGGTGTVTVQFGSSGAAPTTGDPEWEGEFVYLNSSVSMSGNTPVMNFTAEPTGATPPAWGTVT